MFKFTHLSFFLPLIYIFCLLSICCFHIVTFCIISFLFFNVLLLLSLLMSFDLSQSSFNLFFYVFYFIQLFSKYL